jgi:hypothetical protein
MENKSDKLNTAGPAAVFCNLPSPLRDLLQVLLTDVATDVGLVARELSLHDAMLDRLQCALDKLQCAGSVLEAMAGIMPEKPFEGTFNDAIDDATRREGLVPIDPPKVGAAESAWRSLELLAENWPRDYPEDAVEWLLFKDKWPALPF